MTQDGPGEGKTKVDSEAVFAEEDYYARKLPRLPSYLRTLCHIYVRVWGPKKYRVVEAQFDNEVDSLLREVRSMLYMFEAAEAHLMSVQEAWNERTVVEQQGVGEQFGNRSVQQWERDVAVPDQKELFEEEPASEARQTQEEAEQEELEEVSSLEDL